MRKVSAGFLPQDLLHRRRHAFQPLNLAFVDRRRAELEGDGVEVDATGLVADARRTLHLVDRVEALDAFDGRLLQERIVGVRIVHPLGIEDVLLFGNSELQGRQVETGVAPFADAVVVVLVDIDEDIFAIVRRKARAPDDVAVAIADGYHARAVVAEDGLPRAAARQFLVVDVARPAGEAGALVALHDHLVVNLDDGPVAHLAQHFRLPRPLAHHLLGPHLDPATLLGGDRLDLGRRQLLLGGAIVGRRRRRCCRCRFGRSSGLYRLRFRLRAWSGGLGRALGRAWCRLLLAVENGGLALRNGRSLRGGGLVRRWRLGGGLLPL